MARRLCVALTRMPSLPLFDDTGTLGPSAIPRACVRGVPDEVCATRKEALMALARVVSFEGVGKDRIEELEPKLAASAARAAPLRGEPQRGARAR